MPSPVRGENLICLKLTMRATPASARARGPAHNFVDLMRMFPASARARESLRFPYGAAARRKSVPAGGGRIVGPDTWAALWEIRPRRGRAVMLMAT